MKISRSAWIHISLAIIIAIVALFFIRLHNAGGNLSTGGELTFPAAAGASASIARREVLGGVG